MRNRRGEGKGDGEVMIEGIRLNMRMGWDESSR